MAFTYEQQIAFGIVIILVLSGIIGISINFKSPQYKLTRSEQQRNGLQFVGGVNPYLGEKQGEGVPAFVGILVVLLIASIFGTIMAFTKKQSEGLIGYAQQTPFLRQGVFQ